MNRYGYMKIREVRRTEHGLVYEVSYRTWHPSWWALCWRATVGAMRELREEHGGSPAIYFPVALWLWLRMLIATVRL